ncbi:MAG: TIGR03087 family PEP-CTERM/XrtA system glycosyltransferase, partial [Gemmatimonadaceae bacterium]|nr:TIGR03087 family PEP-CTERM/XrtA system glycosyltransferase [Acetobacteraceae bacterium]
MKPNLIFIAHRIPYPPNKGEKIRGFHLLQHLAQTYNIHLGCLADDPDDLRHAVTLRDLCADVAVFPMDKRRQKLKALATLRPGRPLMLDYYRHDGLRRWVEDTMTRQSMDVVYVYTVAMAPYVQQFDHRRVILDALDVDSEKWTAYARQARWPMRAVWAREGRTLLAYERQAAMTAHATLFVSQAECDRFVQLAPETAGRVHPVEIGVDLERFAPGKAYPPPFEGEGPHLVFTGTMDYWPNVEAVQWFVSEILPLVRRRHAGAQFHIVGSSPSPAVLRLAAPGVHVTGRVADMRPYLAHADVCVAPLRIARG